MSKKSIVSKAAAAVIHLSEPEIVFFFDIGRNLHSHLGNADPLLNGKESFVDNMPSSYLATLLVFNISV